MRNKRSKKKSLGKMSKQELLKNRVFKWLRIVCENKGFGLRMSFIYFKLSVLISTSNLGATIIYLTLLVKI